MIRPISLLSATIYSLRCPDMESEDFCAGIVTNYSHPACLHGYSLFSDEGFNQIQFGSNGDTIEFVIRCLRSQY